MKITKIEPKTKDERGDIADIFYKHHIDHVAVINSKKGTFRGDHYHKKSLQYIYITKGSLRYYYKMADEPYDKVRSVVLQEGDMVTTPPFEIHSLEILEDNQFIVFVEGVRGGKDYEKDTYRVKPSLMKKRKESSKIREMKKFIPQVEPLISINELNAMNSYLKSGAWLTEYNKTEEFEDLICKFTGAKHSVVLTNGTVALTLALLACGIKPKDEILVPDLTMIATANCAKLIGVEPVFVDVGEDTLCMDIKKAKSALTSKTKALIYVSLNGRSGNMNKVKKFCRDNNLILIEDAAQSLGSFYKGKHLGTFSNAGTFSFSPHKIITTGQGGAIITNSKDTYIKIKKLKDFGRLSGGADIHDSIGYNFKFTDLQSVIGIEQIKTLKERMARKKEIYKLYYNGLKDVDGIDFLKTNLNSTTPWAIDIFVNDPDKLALYLKKKNIGTRRIYPPIHSQKAYNIKKHFPVTERFSSSGLWLPSSLKLTDREIKFICKVIKQFLERK